MNIAILLSTYNGEKYIKEQIDSLLSQTYTNFEILVRDDGSADETIKVIKNFQNVYPEKIKILESHDKNLGSSKSFMTLLEYCNAEYIMFCDQDDVWLPEKIEWTLKKMHELEKLYGLNTPLLVFSDLTVVGEKLKTIDQSFWHYQKLNPNITTSWKKLLAQNVITGCTMMINKSVKKISLPFGLNEMQHDHWIGVNVAKYGEIAHLSEQTILYRQHGKNVEGAQKFGYRYAWKKICSLTSVLHKQISVVKYFEDISLFRLMFYKLTLNLQRFIQR